MNINSQLSQVSSQTRLSAFPRSPQTRGKGDVKKLMISRNLSTECSDSMSINQIVHLNVIFIPSLVQLSSMIRIAMICIWIW